MNLSARGRADVASARHLPSTTAAALMLATLLAHGDVAAQPSKERGARSPTDPPAASATLPTVTVTGAAIGTAESAPRHPGGQVARGGRLGMLGTVDLMDAPFNVTSYTDELIENQQARSLPDVLANDPSVRNSVSSGSFYENVTVRGFGLGASEIALLGLYGLTPITRTSLAFAERIDVIKGPAVMLTGMPPGGAIGGTISITPKRAADHPLYRLGTSLDSRTRTGFFADLGQRFGPDGAVGVRVNGLTRSGEGAVKNEDRKTNLGSVAVDYQSERLRLALDAYSQNEFQDGGTYGLTSSGVVPFRVPDSSRPSILGQTADISDRMVLLSGELDLNHNITTFAKYGWHTTEVSAVRTRITNLAVNGDFRGAHAVQNTRGEFQSGEAGMRLRLDTGPVRHRIVASASRFAHDNYFVGFNAATADYVLRNIYDPQPLPAPLQFPTATDRRLSAQTRLTSVAVADTMSFLDERLLLTVGLRRQSVEVDNFNTTTGAATTRYDKSATTPGFGIVFRPVRRLSVYANYVEGLIRGPTAPTGQGLINEGEVFPPYKAKQYEVGAKTTWDSIGASISLFQIARPNSLTQNNIFSLDGEQRNRGIEMNLFGEAARGVRVLGGLAFMDAEITKANSTNAGNRAYGIPSRQANLGAEWDLSFAPGLTVSARMLHTGPVYLNSANTVSLPSWTRWDLGARYAQRIAGKPVVFRANVENVTDRRHWMGNDTENWLSVSAPRTIMLSATIDF